MLCRFIDATTDKIIHTENYMTIGMDQIIFKDKRYTVLRRVLDIDNNLYRIYVKDSNLCPPIFP